MIKEVCLKGYIFGIGWKGKFILIKKHTAPGLDARCSVHLAVRAGSLNPDDSEVQTVRQKQWSLLRDAQDCLYAHHADGLLDL
ncbi:hypothetical protein A8L51_21990 [Pantoea stewartii]|nr:hypothetical protein [Pantoea stewartii]